MKRLRTVNRRGRQAEQREALSQAVETGPSSPGTGEAARRPRANTPEG